MLVKEKLEKILNDLRGTRGVEASAAVNRDGLLIYSTINRNAETFVAMLATMFGAAEVTARELGKDDPRRVIVESKQGTVIATGDGSKVLLLVLTRPDANLGLVLVETERALDKIKEIFEGS